MHVRAIKRGFYGDDLKEVGEIFEVADGAKASWFVPAEGEAGPPADPGKRRGGGSPRKSAAAEGEAGPASQS
ncbi:MAG: hypothetical protein AB7E55_03215 [Pigmentiphaga sp.]